jgi:outer membrane receptor protein involved in Fe transport
VNNQTNQSDVFELFGASINYKKKDSPWEFRLQANNLLNTQTRNTSNFNVNGFSATQFVILPRIITFTLRYNL